MHITNQGCCLSAEPPSCAEMRVIGTQACPSGSPPMALAGGRLYNLSDQGVLDAAMLEAFAPLQV